MADVHNSMYVPNKSEIESMNDRMLAFIFPNELKTNAQKEAFDTAVLYQIAHEKTIASQAGDLTALEALPEGVSSFTIGTFSMDFEGGYRKSVMLDRSTICPYAYGVLLRAGLLYRGVLGGCGCGAD